MKNQTISVGSHLLIDFSNCCIDMTNNIDFILSLLHKLADSLQVSILKENFYKFEPHGITAFAIVSASHISIHTWPEYDYISIDIFSCKPIDKDQILTLLTKTLKTSSYDFSFITRNAQI